MDIKEYFDEIQNYIKNNSEHPENIDSLIKSLSKDQIRKRTYQEYDRLNHLLELELT